MLPRNGHLLRKRSARTKLYRMQLVRTLPALRAACTELRATYGTLAFVPTMGALHEGHKALVRTAVASGAPTVVSTAPRLSDGTPFPTFYYLTHPVATASMSFLEAAQLMVEFTELLEGDAELRAAYRAAHEQYLADRESIAVVAEIAGISAGGMPTRVKCLHALAGHALAAGPGVNPIGDLALERSSWSPDVCRCPDYGVDDLDAAESA